MISIERSSKRGLFNEQTKRNVEKYVPVFKKLINESWKDAKQIESFTKKDFVNIFHDKLKEYDITVNLNGEDTIIVGYNSYINIIIDCESYWRDKKLYDILK